MIEFAARQWYRLGGLYLAQFVLVEVFLVLEEVGQLEVDFRAALVLQTRALGALQAIDEICEFSIGFKYRPEC